jgi:hypothetical protein
MTPKDKATQLVEKYLLQLPAIDNGRKWCHQTIFEYDINLAKLCALIAIDEILKLNHPIVIVYTETSDNLIEQYTQEYYWEQVKHEIEKL